MGGGIETPDLPAGVTDPGAAPRDPVTTPEEVVYKNINGEVITPAEEVTGSSSSSAAAVTPAEATVKDLFDITVPPQEKGLPGNAEPVESHPEAAAQDTKALPGKKSSRKG